MANEAHCWGSQVLPAGVIYKLNTKR